jgi:hypothetical protein
MHDVGGKDSKHKNAPVQDPALRKRWKVIMKVMVTFRPIKLEFLLLGILKQQVTGRVLPIYGISTCVPGHINATGK